MKTITIKGKEYPCRVTMGAMVRFKRMTGKDISMLEQSDIEGLVWFVFCCVASACAADGVEFGLSFDEFADLLEPGELNGFYETSMTDEKKTTRTDR